MKDHDRVQALMANAASTLDPFLVSTRVGDDRVVVDLVKTDGTLVWPDYSSGPDALLATLAAEQRYLSEEVGSGAMPGASYIDKARERARRSLGGLPTSAPGIGASGPA